MIETAVSNHNFRKISFFLSCAVHSNLSNSIYVRDLTCLSGEPVPHQAVARSNEAPLPQKEEHEDFEGG